jgi:hypothetical protein
VTDCYRDQRLDFVVSKSSVYRQQEQGDGRRAGGSVAGELGGAAIAPVGGR